METLRNEELKSSGQWLRRTLLVLFCLGLLVAIGAVFTRVIAARVPEQRATLERLITDRTGLAVRFDNVHFAWGMEGTSAVFERVELTDPVRGRVRVVAPELRVEFDAWDFLRHQQFQLGHVTISSPDIDIIGDAEPESSPAQTRSAARSVKVAPEGEAALVRRFTAWSELMPVGRVEVEGARVHLYRRGERVARHHFSLSQAVVSRGSHDFNAFGTLLLSQDIGQSVFISAKLDGLGGEGPRARGLSGELRFIARRVFLDKLPAISGIAVAARGRGTVDARLALREGRIHGGSWQLSTRELQMPRGARFDHFTVQGRLERVAQGFQLQFTDLQVTRGARLERAPSVTAWVNVEPGTLQVSRVTARAERVPFMAAEFLASALSPRLEGAFSGPDAEWLATAGELRDLRFDSHAATLSAQVNGAEFTRASDHTRVSELSGRVEMGDDEARLTFDGTPGALLHFGEAEPRAVQLTGAVNVRDAHDLEFASLRLQSGDAAITADGSWSVRKDGARPLLVQVAQVDRSLLGDLWSLLSFEPPAQFADLHEGQVVQGRLTLLPSADPSGYGVDWLHSRGSLQLAGLASTGANTPSLRAAGGILEFSRGAAQLRLNSGTLEDLQLTDARIDWPRTGAPRLRATAQGSLQSPLLRRVLEEHDLQRLTGVVTLEADARGEAQLRAPESWRVTAHLSGASLPLPDGLPPVEKLAGTVRLAAGELRGLSLAGSWLGGPVEIESRRAGARGVTAANVRGVADSAPLLKWLGHPEAAGRIAGQMDWSGTLQSTGEGAWQLTLASNLNGIESRLPAPFDKNRSRSVPVSAELRFDAQGVRDFSVESGRDAVRGRVHQGLTEARFDIQGVSGELRAASDSSDPRLTLERLDLRRAPAVLAAAGALLPQDRELSVHVRELRHANRGVGAMQASLTKQANGIEFSLESAEGAAHQLAASGRCDGDEYCNLEFSLDTDELPALLGDAKLPAEWPTRSLRASGDLAWRGDDDAGLARALTGKFELETQGADSAHQLMASAVLADGQIELRNVQGTGPDPDQVFRGSGRVRLAARTYDLTVDYEQVSLAASAVPTPARMRLSRAWSSLRGSAAQRGWTDTAPAKRVQWHGTWDGD